MILSLFALLMFPFLGTGGRALAQNRTDYINTGLGYLLENNVEGTVSFEHETKYHNAWEYFVSASLKYEECKDCGHICDESFWNNYNTVAFGVAYKPCVIRGRNHHGNLRFGASVGCATGNDIVTGLHAGYEHSYTLHSGWQLYWQVKCDGMINGKDAIRGGIAAGIKIPCKK